MFVDNDERKDVNESGFYNIESNESLFNEWRSVDTERVLGTWTIPLLHEFANIVKNDQSITESQLSDWSNEVLNFQLAFHPNVNSTNKAQRAILKKINDLKSRTINYIDESYVKFLPSGSKLEDMMETLPYVITFTYGETQKKKSFMAFLSSREKFKLVEEFKEEQKLSLFTINRNRTGVYENVKHLIVSKIEEVYSA